MYQKYFELETEESNCNLEGNKTSSLAFRLVLTVVDKPYDDRRIDSKDAIHRLRTFNCRASYHYNYLERNLVHSSSMETGHEAFNRFQVEISR